MITSINPNPLYDLTNKHFARTEITLSDGRSIKGRFVQFKVVKGKVEYLYPSEKYCFLPEEFENEFSYYSDKTGGEFSDMPGYVIQLGLHQIKAIHIQPSLV